MLNPLFFLFLLSIIFIFTRYFSFSDSHVVNMRLTTANTVDIVFAFCYLTEKSCNRIEFNMMVEHHHGEQGGKLITDTLMWYRMRHCKHIPIYPVAEEAGSYRQALQGRYV